ncbi:MULTISPECIES: MATE family efflux transporter [unclassified Agarivorans]|uniref:MATE family efflux transporter n=1 Tax=unclassified Agarivorans TaxID=2636026 RepID=UPI0026E2291C|nr:MULTISPECIES: MATE family efflux transporter [unclassified Agarivorans]MDO6685169.1 MATE family efflux transporter [Agarivorans sp. 3_MG-2023]MDO6715659.1 MATE family efflux transporter [Agarivorans sp. 2_MG-2023]
MPKAKFVSGDIFRHIVVMSSTNAIGLTALFLVDLADLFFISLLGEAELAAAVGYAGTIAFFTTSISIGLSIAMTALVSKAIGQQDKARARQLVTNILFTGFIISASFAALVWYFAPELLSLIGAKARTHELAVTYIRILLPSLPILGLAMSAGAALRSVGDAKRAMWSTLAGGGVNAVLDPIFIFALGLGLPGAAIASVIARFVVAGVALYGVVYEHNLFARFSGQRLLEDLRGILKVAGPAMMTNVATPLGNAYVTAAIAVFGDAYVAGWAVVGRIMPVAFGMIFSLSGAIGPIVGQNFGAHYYDRVREALSKALWFNGGFVVVVSLLMLLGQNHIIKVFGVGGEAATVIAFFCTWISFSFVFNGAMFVANAAFNNLGYPSTSTMLNFGKATLGTMPFVYLGGEWFGPLGVLGGQALGTVVFGLLALRMAFYVVGKVTDKHQSHLTEQEQAMEPSVPLTPFCSSRAYMCAEAEVDNISNGEAEPAQAKS